MITQQFLVQINSPNEIGSVYLEDVRIGIVKQLLSEREVFVLPGFFGVSLNQVLEPVHDAEGVFVG